jgi:hypothetical protein
MIRNLKMVAAAAACALLVACNADKGPADVAIKAADQAITAAAPEAGKYVPEQLAAAKDALKAAQDQFAKGDYKGALAAATELGNKAKDLVAAAAAKKDELTKSWTELSGSLPQMVEAIKSRVEILGKAKKLPKGMDAAKLTQAKDGLAGITKSWEEASAAFTAGNLTDALGKANGLKEKGTEILALLGMAPAAPAPAAPAPVPAK